MKFIIDFKDHVQPEHIETHVNALGGNILKTFNLSNKTYLVECPAEPVFDPAIHEHIINDDTSTIELLSTIVVSDQTWATKSLNGPVVEISTSDKKDWWKNYVVMHPEFDEPTYKIDRRGKDYTVYVLDSGCEISHPEFLNRPVINLFTFNNDFSDINGHGTAIASVITGVTCGITEATVKSVKIFDSRQQTKQSDLLNALDAIHKDFVDNQMSFAIINCSWAISKNLFIESKLQNLINMGCVVVAAAGNNGVPIEDVTPASMDSATTLGSYNSDLEPSDFSNYTSSSISVSSGTSNHGAVDGWAPGEEIYTACLNNTYGFVSGTSIAAAIHSAVSVYNLTVIGLEYRGEVSKNTFIQTQSLNRFNILDLSDPKYVNSKNQVTTLKDFLDERPAAMKFAMVSKAKSGTTHNLRIFDPRTTKTLEILKDLPNGFKVTNIGVFMGLAPFVQLPTLETIPMKLVDVNDEIYEFDFEIINVPDTWNTETDTTGDEYLDMSLSSFATFCSGNDCELLEGGCADNCATVFGTICFFVEDKFTCGGPPAGQTYYRCSCNPF